MLRGSERETALSKLKKATDRYEIQAKGTQEEITNLFLLRQKCSENLLHTSKTMWVNWQINQKNSGRDADLVVMVDCQIPSDDLIVHFFWFWKADCPSGKALKVSPQIQVMTLYSLGIFLADYMAGWVQQRPVYRPRIGHVEGNIKFAQQCQKPL